MQAVPYDLVRQLPPPPRGTRYIYDADQVLLVDINTRVVLDFINISISSNAPMAVVPAPVVFSFSNDHRYLAHDYYHRHPHHHGKKHKWKKRWRYKRKSHLHRDVQMQTVPYDLVRQFPPAPYGTRYIYDSEQILLVDESTRVVLDFINISIPVDAPIAVAPAPVVFSFNDNHRHSVRDYYHTHPRHHGKKHKWKKKWEKKRKRKKRKRERDRRPPGWAKHDVLPPEIRVEAIHVDLARQLPRPPRGTQYTYHEDQVLLIDLSTRVVLDFINISISAGY
jgi:Ni/Co efflux regulator RcnB